MDHPLPWLRYLDASDIDDDAVDFDGLDVVGPEGEKLGTVSGFIVDTDSARPYYVVIDAGGWFKSKHFLLPVGHARLSADREALAADITRERIDRFPGFDLDEFDKLTDADIRRMNDEICTVCGTAASSYAANEPTSAAWKRADYAYPDWWHAEPSHPDRMGDTAFRKPVEYRQQAPTSPPGASAPRDRIVGAQSHSEPNVADERTQPGDVIGIEGRGSETHLGDTVEDERKRRRKNP